MLHFAPASYPLFSLLRFMALQFQETIIMMAPTNLSGEGKARILAWKTENVSTKEISRRTGRGESTIRRLVATAK